MARAGGNGETDYSSLRIHAKTRQRINALVGNIDFWGGKGFKIAPGSADEVVNGLIDIAEREAKA